MAWPEARAALRPLDGMSSAAAPFAPAAPGMPPMPQFLTARQ
jgi:hypothetical protein